MLVVEDRDLDELLEDHTRELLAEGLLSPLFTQFYLLGEVTLYAAKRKALDLEEFVNIKQLDEAVLQEEVK